MASHRSSIDWPRIELEYLAGEDSIREIADRHCISDTAIRRRAKKEGWVRKVRTPVRRAPERQKAPPAPIAPETPVEPSDIVGDGRNLAFRMLDELDVITSRRGELEDIIISATDDDDDDARRDALMKSISLPVRANTLKTIAQAVKTLSEAEAPEGKKAAAERRAKELGGGQRFAAMGPPKLKAVK